MARRSSGTLAAGRGLASDPGKMVVMGRVLAPWGIQGWLKVESYGSERGNLCNFPAWWVGRAGELRQVQVDECRVHGAHVVARLRGCADRDQAAAYRGSEVAVPRAALPPPGPDEYYESDLVGFAVRNLRGEPFGEVEGMMDSGAHPILRVVREGSERLLPFVPAVVRRVDPAARLIEVDWELDW